MEDKARRAGGAQKLTENSRENTRSVQFVKQLVKDSRIESAESSSSKATAL